MTLSCNQGTCHRWMCELSLTICLFYKSCEKKFDNFKNYKAYKNLCNLGMQVWNKKNNVIKVNVFCLFYWKFYLFANIAFLTSFLRYIRQIHLSYTDIINDKNRWCERNDMCCFFCQQFLKSIEKRLFAMRYDYLSRNSSSN